MSWEGCRSNLDLIPQRHRLPVVFYFCALKEKGWPDFRCFPIHVRFPLRSESFKLATQKKYGLIRAILSRSITRDEKRIRTKIFSFLNEKLCDHIEIIIIITFIMPKFYIMIKCAIPSHLICARRSTIDWKRNASRKKTIQLRFIARKLIQNW